MKRRAIQVCVVFFPTPIPASAHVHTHARVNAHTRIHLMLNAPKRGTFKLQALDPSLGQSVSGSSSSSSSSSSSIIINACPMVSSRHGSWLHKRWRWTYRMRLIHQRVRRSMCDMGYIMQTCGRPYHHHGRGSHVHGTRYRGIICRLHFK